MRDAVREGFLERLRSESNIVSVVSDYVPLKRKGLSGKNSFFFSVRR